MIEGSFESSSLNEYSIPLLEPLPFGLTFRIASVVPASPPPSFASIWKPSKIPANKASNKKPATAGLNSKTIEAKMSKNMSAPMTSPTVISSFIVSASVRKVSKY